MHWNLRLLCQYPLRLKHDRKRVAPQGLALAGNPFILLRVIVILFGVDLPLQEAGEVIAGVLFTVHKNGQGAMSFFRGILRSRHHKERHLLSFISEPILRRIWCYIGDLLVVRVAGSLVTKQFFLEVKNLSALTWLATAYAALAVRTSTGVGEF